MGDVTGISWTDSTFNPWIGCTKVGPGCDHCYAETEDARRQWGGAKHWGAGVPRHRTSVAYWKNPVKWNRDGWRRVFCASLADVFDNEAPQEWRDDLWELIASTPSLTWLILTKRIGNVNGMAEYWHRYGWPHHVWIGATIVDAEEAKRDAPKLRLVPAKVRFISYEPALGPVDWTKYPWIDWIIVGGESTQGASARDFDVEWAYNTITQAVDIGAAPFVKQLGSRQGLKDRAGADPGEWPIDLRVQEYPTPRP